jgi:hypothetical protein
MGKALPGCLIILVVAASLAFPFVWGFLKASWPTWGFLLLVLVLLLLLQYKKENLFCKATEKVLQPVAVGLGMLMVLEVLFGLFKSFFSDERVAAVEDAIIKAHFAMQDFEHHLGFVIPLCVAIAVAFLCLTVGNWQYSSALAKLKNVFRFVSVALLVMASFTFFRYGAADTLLDWEKDQNQRWYEMALAKEERSVARLIAARNLRPPLRHLDPESQKNFETFFTSLKQECATRQCFQRNDLNFTRYGDPTVNAFNETILHKVSEDYRQFAPDRKFPESDALTGIPHPFHWPNRDLPTVSALKPANVDLTASTSAQEKLLSRRAFSQNERDQQKKIIADQQTQANTLERSARTAKERIAADFASVLAATVPDAEGIVGAYVKELIDATAEWIVRPFVDAMFNQGYRPETIQDIFVATGKIPPSITEKFSEFHSVGTKNGETSEFRVSQSVDEYFEDNEKANQKLYDDMRHQMEEYQKKEEDKTEVE